MTEGMPHRQEKGNQRRAIMNLLNCRLLWIITVVIPASPHPIQVIGDDRIRLWEWNRANDGTE
jgi:hypothetical protein